MGGVLTFGDAAYYGSAAGMDLAKPIVGMAAAPTGHGYWLVASDGGIFSFGSAGYYGSMGGKHLAKPIVGMAAAPTGHGYWLVASDGGIFSFGSAGYHGSMGGKQLNSPVIGMAANPAGGGYWLVASDGGIFSFGSAGYHGSMGGQHLNAPVVAMAVTPGGAGYWEAQGGSATYAGSGSGGGVASGTPTPIADPALSTVTTHGTWENGGYIIQATEWNSTTPQTTFADSYENWGVTVNFPGAPPPCSCASIKTYPDVSKLVSNIALSHLTKVRASYTEQMPRASLVPTSGTGYDAEAAFDIWWDTYAKELMFWVTTHRTLHGGTHPSGTLRASTLTIGGMKANFYVDSASYAGFQLKSNTPSGTVTLLAAFKDAEAAGYLQPTSSLHQLSFGWEIASTTGKTRTFRVTDYSLTLQ